MVAILTFCLSLAALSAFVLLKGWELRKKRVLAPAFRARADAFVLSATAHLTHHSLQVRPGLAKHLLREAAHEVTVLLLRVVHVVERQLLGVVNMIKGKGTVRHGATASEFLKNIAEHKKNNRGQIFEQHSTLE